MFCKLCRKLLKNNYKGVLIVEMALILPFFLYFVFNIIFMGIAIIDRHSLETVAREGSRIATIKYAESKIPDSGITADKILVDIKNQLKNDSQDRLILYSFIEEESKVEIKNEAVILNLKAEAPAYTKSFYGGIVPATMHTYLVMRVEDHTRSSS